MRRYTLHNLSCPSCASKLEDALRALPFIKRANIDFNTGILSIDSKADVSKENFEAIRAKIKQIEPQVEISQDSKDNDEGQPLFRLARLILFFTIALVLYFMEQKLIAEALFLIVYIESAINVFKKAFHSLKNKIFFDEYCLMLLATLAAICLGEIGEAAAVLLFFSIGEYLEARAISKSKDSIQKSLEIMPNIAHKREGANYTDIHPSNLNIDDIVLVKNGERIPCDSISLGSSYLDMMSLNGESEPLSIKHGDRVLAGAINVGSAIEVRIAALHEDSEIAKIRDIIENARNLKPHTQRLITRFSQIYTPIMFCVALFVAFVIPIFLGDFREWLHRGLVVLMISCPCALMLSIPLGYFGALGIASKRGIIIKGSLFLEKLSDLKAICFDKTGTLTKGEFSINHIESLNGFSKDEVILYAKVSQQYSNHPLSQAILALNTNEDFEVRNIADFDSKENVEIHVENERKTSLQNLDSKDSSTLSQNDNNFQYDDNHRHVERSETSFDSMKNENPDSKDSSITSHNDGAPVMLSGSETSLQNLDSSHSFRMTDVRHVEALAQTSTKNLDSNKDSSLESYNDTSSQNQKDKSHNTTYSVMLSGSETSLQNLDSDSTLQNDINKQKRIITILEHTQKAGRGIIATCREGVETYRILMGNSELMCEHGIETSGDRIYIAKDNVLIGSMDMGDTLKQEAHSVIDELRKLHVTPLAILSGDSPSHVESVAKALRIDKFFPSLLPTQKAEILKELKGGDSIAFMGDGINDAVVLANADIGISIHAANSSSDINKQSADIILTRPNLTSLISAIKIARKTRFITWQNIIFILSVKLLILALGIFGFANMWLAVFGDVGVALLSLANAMRVVKV